jgi:hypothetical protein
MAIIVTTANKPPIAIPTISPVPKLDKLDADDIMKA